MLTHQTENTVPGEIYNVYRYRERSFYPHFHRSFELAYLIRGTALFTVNGKEFPIAAGDFVMVLPFEPHTFTVSGDGELVITVFSAGLAAAFSQMTRGMQGDTAVFRCGEAARLFFEAGIAATAEKLDAAVYQIVLTLECFHRIIIGIFYGIAVIFGVISHLAAVFINMRHDFVCGSFWKQRAFPTVPVSVGCITHEGFIIV